MQLEHSFVVPVGVDEAWKILLDLEQMAPCMPGASLDSVTGDEFTGTVKVRLGPIALTYKGVATFVEKDDERHRVVINAHGRDARGNGTARAQVTATLTAQADTTKVDVQTDLDVTGKPAQFGRGVIADVGSKLIGQFADNLAAQLVESGPAADQGPGESDIRFPAPPAEATAAPRRAAESEPINLFESAGPAMAKRLVPLVGAVVLVVLVVARLRRRRR